MLDALTCIDFNQLRFLIVDDNANMRRIIRTFLHGFGSREVHEAEDDAKGLAGFAQFMPDIVIIDLAMPVIGGIALTKMIRQPGIHANPYIPIIMLTCHAEKSNIVAARDAGIAELLAKPISVTTLHERIFNVVTDPRRSIKTKTYFGPDHRRNVDAGHVGHERRRDAKADVV